MSLVLQKLFPWTFQQEQSQADNSGETWGEKKDIQIIINDEN